MTQDPFDVLGLPATFALDPAVLEARVRDLQRALHPDKHAQGTPAERRMALSRAVSVNEAYRALRDDLSRATALLRLRGRDPKETGGPADPAFLMEIMELRERLGEARASGAIDDVRALAAQVSRALTTSSEALARALDGNPDPRSAKASPAAVGPPSAGAPADLDRAEAELARMRYYRRFLDEAALAEEDAHGPAADP